MKEEDEVIEEKPEEEKVEKSKGWNWGMIVVGVFVVMVLAGLAAPMTMTCRKAAGRTEAINNAKQVGLALLEFDQEFGSFPDAETAAKVDKVSELNPKLDLSGTSANAMFRQLIAFGIQSEDIFYCLHPEGIRKPDKKLSPGNALAAGEVGFSYIMLDGKGQNTSGNPGRAVLATPMKIGTETFWPKPHGQKAVILRLDNSVEAPLIRKADGKVSVGNGKTLFDTGVDTVWGDVGPIEIHHPERGR